MNKGQAQDIVSRMSQDQLMAALRSLLERDDTTEQAEAAVKAAKYAWPITR